MQGPTFDELLQPFPSVQKWMSRVAEGTNPRWGEAGAVLYKVAQRGKERKAKASQSKV